MAEEIEAYLEWANLWIKGIRNLSLHRLLLLMAKYCYGHPNVEFIDFHGRYKHKPEQKVLNKVKDVVKLFVEEEGMSKRTAYDYANAIERIQFLTS